MFILKSTHNAAIDQQRDEIARLNREAEGLIKRLKSAQETSERVFLANTRLAAANDKMVNRLKVFDRVRGAGGRFVASGDGDPIGCKG